MSWLSDFIHPGRPYQAAQDKLNQAQEESKGYLEPYSQGGIGAMGNIQSMIEKLMNPKDFQNELLEGYEESPYAKSATDVATESGRQLAEQMGLSGSSNEMSGVTATAGNIAQKDRNQYLQNLMDMYGKAGDMSQGLYSGGLGASQGLSQGALQTGRDQAGLETAKRQANAGMAGTGIGVLGSFLGLPTGAGSSVGGDIMTKLLGGTGGGNEAGGGEILSYLLG